MHRFLAKNIVRDLEFNILTNNHHFVVFSHVWTLRMLLRLNCRCKLLNVTLVCPIFASPQFSKVFLFAGRRAGLPGRLSSLVWSRLSGQSLLLPTVSSHGPLALPEGCPIPLAPSLHSHTWVITGFHWPILCSLGDPGDRRGSNLIRNQAELLLPKLGQSWLFLVLVTAIGPGAGTWPSPDQKSLPFHTLVAASGHLAQLLERTCPRDGGR